MPTQIVMPQLGESIAEGTVTKWLKKEGEAVKQDEPLLEISTDKVDSEIPSPAAGVLTKIIAGEGVTVKVGSVIGQIGEKGEVAAPVAPAASQEAPAPKAVAPKAPEPSAPAPAPALQMSAPASTAPAASGRNNFLSPLVRRIAQEHNISENEIAQIPGNGHDARVTKKDILAYVENRPAVAQNSMTSAPVPKVAAASVQVQFSSGQAQQIVPMSNMRRVIMENMINSRRTSAHVTTFFEVDYTKIDQVRNASQKQFKEQEGVSLTYTTFLAAAVCQVLKRHPYINAQIREDKIVFNKDVHLGIAVSISAPEPGLMVPVIKNCDQINLRGIAHALNDLSTRTRGRKIKPDELSGGTFTITNPGNFGAIIGTPIINQPQAAILGVGAITKQPKVITVDGSDMLGIRNIGMLALSFDHRLIDGATADMFMADLKQTLESWTTSP